MSTEQSLTTSIGAQSKGGSYKYYALAVLCGVALLNAADRQILSILAEAIKADLKVDDAQIAFLYGTAFVTLYTVLGLPIARLADRMVRTTLLSGGLALWSGITALSGFAPTFGLLSFARFGVGVGEATAVPVSYSLLSDFFPPKRRAAAFGVYLGGMSLGAGLAAFIGGQMLTVWPARCGELGLCAIRPWQAAFLVVGLPGLALALLVLALRHPVRGEIEGHPVVPAARGHWMAFLYDLASVAPGTGAIVLWKHFGRAPALRNLLTLTAILAAALALGRLTGDYAQWICIFFSVSAIVGWVQRTDRVDPQLIRLTFRTPAFVYAVAGFALMGCVMGAAHFWMVPHAIRSLGVAPNVAGMVLGPAIALSSLAGAIGGGFLSDAWRVRYPRGYMWFVISATVAFSLLLIPMMSVHSFAAYTVLLFLFNTASASWAGAAAAYAFDLVVPRMRASTLAAQGLCITLVTMAAGPYLAGKLGLLFGSLVNGVLSLLVLAPVGLLFLLLSANRFPAAEASKFQRAGA